MAPAPPQAEPTTSPDSRGSIVLELPEASSAPIIPRPPGDGDNVHSLAAKKAGQESAREWPAPLPDAPADKDAPRPVADEGVAPPRTGLLRSHPIGAGLAVLLVAAAASLGYVYLDYAQRFEATDDAFIASRLFTLAPKVAGYITEVPVTDNQHVAAGAAIARIDDRDYRTALQQAEAQTVAAEASIKNIDAQIEVQRAQVGASQAQVEAAQAALTFAQEQAARYQDLAQRGAGSVQNAQQYTSALRQQQATVRNAQATLAAVQRQVTSLKAQRGSAEASLAEAKAQRDQAELNLSYTTVTAAQAGRVVGLTASRGEFAQAGTNLAMFVPDEIWVTANFKETQLTAMRPGQPVTMRIDAYSDRLLHGEVASVQPGSGTAFSLLPAQNATGNYVKIVQRVPVKLVITDPPTDVAVGPGMSVVPTVRVEPDASLYERLASFFARLTGHA
jgi:membrane fusion protein, multidrug efflux system